MKVYITVILVCLNKFHIWENSGSWDMVQNALRQSDCRIFQSQDSKTGCISKRNNEINWFLVCPSNSFLRIGSLGFSDFWHNGR